MRRLVPMVFALHLATAVGVTSARGQERAPTQLNYVNAPLGDVIRSLAVALGQNVVLSDVPDTRVTFSTPTAVARGDLGQVLESLLESHGLVLVQSGPLARIVPADKAPATGPIHYGKELPSPPPLGLITQIVPLEAIRADEAVDVLKRAASATARLEVMPRQNAVLITDRGSNVARYLELLRQIDTRSEGEAGLRTYVVPLKHASASELATTLSQLLGVAVIGATESPAQALEERSLSGTLDQFRRREVDALQTRRTTPLVTVAVPQAPTGTPDSLAPTQAAATGIVGQTTIVPSSATNSIIIRTVPPNFPLLEETIRTLDVRPAQVLLEVLIAEIQLSKATRFGINWSLVGRDLAAQFGFQDYSDSSLAQVQDFAARAVSLGSVDVRALLTALSSKSNVRVLSSPHVLAVNNEEARILVGSEVPFSQSTRTGLTEVVDRIIQFRNVGTQLTIIPRINQDGYVTVRLLQEVSALTNQTLEAALNAPIITVREAETSAIVRDGQTIVIGGLIAESQDRVESGVPILKDIPLLGLAFKSNSTRNSRSELAIFVTPRVVYSDEDAERVLEEERGRLRGFPADTAAVPPAAVPRPR
ncbi:MAG: secretin N-terminal domain-containing protein [Gemmatimonadales bacterium]